jgi:Arc/MetJ family transcription regulator
MRVTLDIDDELLAEARQITGIEDMTLLIHEALRVLISLKNSRTADGQG